MEQTDENPPGKQVAETIQTRNLLDTKDSVQQRIAEWLSLGTLGEGHECPPGEIMEITQTPDITA